MKYKFLVFAVLVACLCGCRTYTYRIVKPTPAGPIEEHQAVGVHYDPLDYRFWSEHDRLVMQISNPTPDKITLFGDRSVIVDPRGESHPVRGRVIGPHSHTSMLLPPVPFSYAYPDYSWGWGWGGRGPWGWSGYGPYWDPFYGPAYFGPPPIIHQQVYTPFDWQWEEGLTRLHLTYDRANKFFEQEFEIVRERKK